MCATRHFARDLRHQCRVASRQERRGGPCQPQYALGIELGFARNSMILVCGSEDPTCSAPLRKGHPDPPASHRTVYSAEHDADEAIPPFALRSEYARGPLFRRLRHGGIGMLTASSRTAKDLSLLLSCEPPPIAPRYGQFRPFPLLSRQPTVSQMPDASTDPVRLPETGMRCQVSNPTGREQSTSRASGSRRSSPNRSSHIPTGGTPAVVSEPVLQSAVSCTCRCRTAYAPREPTGRTGTGDHSYAHSPSGHTVTLPNTPRDPGGTPRDPRCRMPPL